MKRVLINLLVLLLMFANEYDLSGQTVVRLPAGNTRIAWDYTPSEYALITSFRIVVDGVRTDLGKLPVDTTLAGGQSFSTPFPALTLGNHVLVIEAFDSATNSTAPSAELNVIVSAGIIAPNNVRIIIIPTATIQPVGPPIVNPGGSTSGSGPNN